MLNLPLTIIGEVTADQRLIAIDADGTAKPLKPQGFLHEF